MRRERMPGLRWRVTWSLSGVSASAVSSDKTKRFVRNTRASAAAASLISEPRNTWSVLWTFFQTLLFEVETRFLYKSSLSGQKFKLVIMIKELVTTWWPGNETEGCYSTLYNGKNSSDARKEWRGAAMIETDLAWPALVHRPDRTKASVAARHFYLIIHIIWEEHHYILFLSQALLEQEYGRSKSLMWLCSCCQAWVQAPNHGCKVSK